MNAERGTLNAEDPCSALSPQRSALPGQRAWLEHRLQMGNLAQAGFDPAIRADPRYREAVGQELERCAALGCDEHPAWRVGAA